MPRYANGMSEDEFYLLLARYEPKISALELPAAWMKFCNWRHYGN